MKKFLVIALLAMSMGCTKSESGASTVQEIVSSAPAPTATPAPTPLPVTTPRPDDMEPIQPLEINVSQVQVEDKVFALGDKIEDVIALIGEPKYVSELEDGKIYLYTDLEVTERNGKVVDVMLLSDRTRIAGEITFGTSLDLVKEKLEGVQEIIGGYSYNGYEGIVAEFYTNDGETVGGIHVYLP